MNIRILGSIGGKNDYLTVLEAVSGTKTSFTEEEKAKLLTIYSENAESGFGFADESLSKMMLVLDTAPDKNAPGTSPLAGELGGADLDALSSLTALCGNWEGKPELAVDAKSAALNGAVSKPLSLALARAALDALASQKDITPYREDITVLTSLLGQAEDKAFEDASKFLIRVRERVR